MTVANGNAQVHTLLYAQFVKVIKSIESRSRMIRNLNSKCPPSVKSSYQISDLAYSYVGEQKMNTQQNGNFENLRNKIAAELNRIRRNSRTDREGLTLRELEKRCGVSRSVLSLAGRGDQRISIESLLLLAKKLEIPYHEIYLG